MTEIVAIFIKGVDFDPKIALGGHFIKIRVSFMPVSSAHTNSYLILFRVTLNDAGAQ